MVHPPVFFCYELCVCVPRLFSRYFLVFFFGFTVFLFFVKLFFRLVPLLDHVLCFTVRLGFSINVVLSRSLSAILAFFRLGLCRFPSLPLLMFQLFRFPLECSPVLFVSMLCIHFTCFLPSVYRLFRYKLALPGPFSGLLLGTRCTTPLFYSFLCFFVLGFVLFSSFFPCVPPPTQLGYRSSPPVLQVMVAPVFWMVYCGHPSLVVCVFFFFFPVALAPPQTFSVVVFSASLQVWGEPPPSNCVEPLGGYCDHFIHFPGYVFPPRLFCAKILLSINVVLSVFSTILIFPRHLFYHVFYLFLRISILHLCYQLALKCLLQVRFLCPLLPLSTVIFSLFSNWRVLCRVSWNLHLLWWFCSRIFSPLRKPVSFPPLYSCPGCPLSLYRTRFLFVSTSSDKISHFAPSFDYLVLVALLFGIKFHLAFAPKTYGCVCTCLWGFPGVVCAPP